MAATNFARMTDNDKRVWVMRFFKQHRNAGAMTRLLGTGNDAVVQRVTELKKTVKGTQAVMTLIPDATGDGTAGDRTLKGNEEALSSAEQVIRVDQLRKAHTNEGRIADQKSIVNFRTEASDQLGYFMGDRQDQMLMLTMAGVGYEYHNNGALRVGSELQYLEFAADVTAPSANRHRRWTGNTTGLLAGNTAADDMAVPTYQMLIEAKAYAQDEYIKPVRGEMGTELYHVFMTPQGVKNLKLDSEFQAAVRDAMPRTPNNPLFKGFNTIYLDGIAIHTQRYVYNTKGADAGSKWGSAGNTDGQRVIFAGAQSIGYAELGAPYWDEEIEDYGNKFGIAIGKIFGFKKPIYPDKVHGTDEDFGLFVMDTLL